MQISVYSVLCSVSDVIVTLKYKKSNSDSDVAVTTRDTVSDSQRI